MNKIIYFLNKIKDSGYNSIYDYCESIEGDISFEQVLDFVRLAFDQLNGHNAGTNNLTESEIKDYTELLSLYSELNPNSKYKVPESKNNHEAVHSIGADNDIESPAIEEDYSDNQNNITIERNSSGQIQYYHYDVLHSGRRITGRFYRDEMQSIYRGYSRYGDNLTAAAVNNQFPSIDPRDFRSILIGFGITKDSKPFAPHMYEEYSDDELLEIDEKERKLRIHRRSEAYKNKDCERAVNRLSIENDNLKKILDSLSNINVKITPSNIEPYISDAHHVTNQSINLYLADMHIGAFTKSDSIYDENKNYGEKECKRRLSEIINRVKQLGPFDTVNLVLLGDNMDCCGHFGQTYQQKHYMPENLYPTEQSDVCSSIIKWFIDSLYRAESGICNHMNVMSVPYGNHTGPIEYVLNQEILGYVTSTYPEIKTTLWKETFGKFEFLNQVFVCTHGRTPEFMKKPLPKELNDATTVKIMEWAKKKNIAEKFHFVKGDLHCANLNECESFTYRNVLSVFGSSDYGNLNYPRSGYGMSYDIIKGDKGEFLLRGEFRNV